eukprot:scaffold34387_cov75-Phaeocystis_antarctica.AAC.1
MGALSVLAYLQPYVMEAATICDGGCNRAWRLQPCVRSQQPYVTMSRRTWPRACRTVRWRRHTPLGCGRPGACSAAGPS